jgi:hypothetical protein
MQDTCLPISTVGFESLQVIKNSDYPVTPELDDEQYVNATQNLPP